MQSSADTIDVAMIIYSVHETSGASIPREAQPPSSLSINSNTNTLAVERIKNWRILAAYCGTLYI